MNRRRRILAAAAVLVGLGLLWISARTLAPVTAGSASSAGAADHTRVVTASMVQSASKGRTAAKSITPTLSSPAASALLRRRGATVARELKTVDEWFRQQPAQPLLDSEMTRRRERTAFWANRLGLKVSTIECRKGACRLEVAPDPSAKRHTMLRPLPRVEQVEGNGLLFRLPGANGPITVFYTATAGGRLPAVAATQGG